MVRQGIAEYNLRSAEKQAFFVTLRRLSECHGRLPNRIITENIEIWDEIPTLGGFACVRSGMYKGRVVAVKAMRVTAQDNFLKIRKVSVGVGYPG